MNESHPSATPDPGAKPAAEAVANFQAYGNAGVMYADGTSSLRSSVSDPAQSFMAALQTLEQHQDIGAMQAQFTGDCKLWRQSTAESYEGAAGLERFWQEYLKQFESIATKFTGVLERDGLAVLEWEIHGALQGGRPLDYRGVSILEFAPDGKVERFKTYFDSAHFIQVQAAGQQRH